MATVFAKRTSTGYAYLVSLLGTLRGTNDRRLVWTDEMNENALHYSDEPMTGPDRRLKAWCLSWIVPEAWL